MSTTGPNPEPSSGRPSDRRFPRTSRLRKRFEFQRVQGHGRRLVTPRLVIFTYPCEAPTRLGLTVTRKVSCAVGRNRIKRVLREVYRLHRELFPKNCDIVIVARQGATSLGYQDALAEVTLAFSGARNHSASGLRSRPPSSKPRSGR